MMLHPLVLHDGVYTSGGHLSLRVHLHVYMSCDWNTLLHLHVGMPTQMHACNVMNISSKKQHIYGHIHQCKLPLVPISTMKVDSCVPYILYAQEPARGGIHPFYSITKLYYKGGPLSYCWNFSRLHIIEFEW